MVVNNTYEATMAVLPPPGSGLGVPTTGAAGKDPELLLDAIDSYSAGRYERSSKPDVLGVMPT